MDRKRDPIHNCGSVTSSGIMTFQLPVVVTAAETVAVGQINDNQDEEGEMISIQRTEAPKATIAAGDDEITTTTTNNNNSSNHTNNISYSDSNANIDITTPDHDVKQKYVLSNMLQSVMELLVSLSFSVLLKLVFGGLCGIRTLLLVHTCNFLMSCLSKTEQVAGRWMIPPSFLQFHAAIIMTSTSSSTVALTTIEQKGSSNRISWPPPTFIALGLFTIGTFIVHPDGYTWIVIHKIRDATYFVMQSSTTCWAIAVNDYGAIISTMLAMSTFAALFFFVYVLHRTLKSRTTKNRQQQQQNQKHSEKHKRKKRKHTNTRNGQKLTGHSGRIETASDIDQDQFIHNTDSIDESTCPNQTELIQNDESFQHVLPPLAEDEPLDSPSTTGSSFNENSVSISKYESSPQHLTSLSSRQRTASSSTADSVAFSLDDQSSCSGRSTPTPISVNELMHPPFVTTPIKSSSKNASTHGVRGKNGGMVSANAPSPILNQNPRRNQNIRRSGKKVSSQSLEVPTIAATNKSPPLTPSKRWDASKPTNRSNTTRQQQQQQRQPLSRKPDRPEPINAGVAPRMSMNEQQKPTELKTQRKTIETDGDCRGFSHNDGSTTLLTGYMKDATYLSSSNVIGNGNSVLDESIIGNRDGLFEPDRISSSGLNPYSNSWTGTMNVVPKDETYTTSTPSFDGNDVFGFDVPSFDQSLPTSTMAHSLLHHPTPPNIIENIHDDYQLPRHGQFYTNERVESSSNGLSLQGGLSVPLLDLSFLHNISGNQIDSVDSNNNIYTNRYPVSSSPVYVPSVDSTMMISNTTTTTTNNASNPMISSPYIHNHHHYHYHRSTHVRDNPFATSDDDDDDQIEAKLLELGGQMVGSILDF